MDDLSKERIDKTHAQYDLLQKYNIIDPSLVAPIKVQRTKFEYLLAKQPKELKVFLDYIMCEQHLLFQVNLQNGLAQGPPHNAAQQFAPNFRPSCNITHIEALKKLIYSCIKSLYIQATNHFAHIERLWDEFLAFLKKINCPYHEMAAIWEKRIVTDSSQNTWLKYIKWERESFKNRKSYDILLVRALKKYPRNMTFYLEYFNFELSLNITKEPNNNITKKSIVIYTNCKKYIPGLKVMVSFLDEITNNFPHEEKMECLILEDMKTYCGEELFWHTIAQRELVGFRTYSSDHIPWRDRNLPVPPDRVKKQTEICIRVYESAVTVINTKEMWAHFLDTLIGINIDKIYPTFKSRILIRSFTNAAKETDAMTEYYFLQFLEVLYTTKANNKKILNVLEQAIAIYSDSAELWLMYMKHYVRADDRNKVKEIFDLAKIKLGIQSHAVYELYFMYLQTQEKPHNHLGSFFEDLLTQTHTNFNNLKTKFLQLSALSGDIVYIRKIFKRITRTGIMCLDIYNEMAKYESQQYEVDYAEWRNCLEEAVKLFGQERTDVWMNLVNFEAAQDIKNVAGIIQRASETLKKDLVDVFLSEWDYKQNAMLTV